MKKSLANYLFLSLFITILIGPSLSSCKKEGGGGSGSTNNQLSDADSLKYFMYRIMQVDFLNGGRDNSYSLPSYYWYNQVPTLNPLSSTYDSAEILLSDMKTYAINPSTNAPYDRYSFLDHGKVATELQQGQANDLGMQVTYALDANNISHLYVLFADKNSPAGLVGVTRGWEITAINGNTNVSTYDGSTGPNVTAVINAVYNDAQATFTFTEPDGTSVTNTLAESVYNVDPVLFDSVYSVAGTNVGYFVFNAFVSVTDNTGAPTLTQQELNRVFAEFQSANISSIIIDLRYNGGGDVLTSQYIDSMIAPASVTGKEMYHYLYNDKLTAMESQLGLQSQVLFPGGGSLQLTNVFFIGSHSTASASELTYNILRPYMNVKLVGDTTYGKPVGFFEFPITDFDNGVQTQLADLYAINFETRNANNQGQYYTGLVPDQLAVDYVNVPWGNTADDDLTKIFSYISTGSFIRTASPRERMAQDASLRLAVRSSLPPLRFNGMVDYKISNQLKGTVNQTLRKQIIKTRKIN